MLLSTNMSQVAVLLTRCTMSAQTSSHVAYIPTSGVAIQALARASASATSSPSRRRSSRWRSCTGASPSGTATCCSAPLGVRGWPGLQKKCRLLLHHALRRTSSYINIHGLRWQGLGQSALQTGRGEASAGSAPGSRFRNNAIDQGWLLCPSHTAAVIVRACVETHPKFVMGFPQNSLVDVLCASRCRASCHAEHCSRVVQCSRLSCTTLMSCQKFIVAVTLPVN